MATQKTSTTKTAAKKATSKKAAAKPSMAAKPSAAAVQAATAKAKAATLRKAFTLAAESRTPYRQLTADRKAFSAWIIAAGIASGVIAMKGEAAPKQAKGAPGLFGLLIGSTARGHWKRTGRIDDSGFTVAGLNEIQARLAGATKGYNTDRETVYTFAQAMAKGGKVEVGGRVYDVTGELASPN